MPKRLIVDLDGTLTLTALDKESVPDYARAAPNLQLIQRLREYQSDGYEIVIHTSRNMRTYQGAVGKITLHTLPIILEWLKRHNVPHDEVIVGKPWCGTEGFYVDDRAIRPAEFVGLGQAAIKSLLGE